MVRSGKKKLVFEKVPVRDGSCIVAEQEHAPLIDCAYHYHPEPELTLVAAGSGRILFGTEWVPFTDGDLALIGGNVPHLFWFMPESGRENRTVVLKFNDAFLHGGLLQLPELRAVAELIASPDSAILWHAAALAPRFLRLPGLPPLEKLFAACSLLDAAARLPGRRLLSAAPPPDGSECLQLERTTRYLQRNFTRKITLADVAAAAGMEPESFRRFFRRRVRISFTDYLVELRLVFAGKLLRETSRGISEIAAASGFANLSNFNRLFRARRGMPPRAYRNL